MPQAAVQAGAPATVSELIATPTTDVLEKELQAEYDEFNKACAQEQVDMNQTLIQNIINRGGDAGWEHAANYDWLKKSFEFSSFEQASAFVSAVGVRAESIDHHPEWHTTDGGRTVNVTLTSHFANNKVTRLDFQLAEMMNEEFSVVQSSFRMHPYLDSKQWATLKIAFGSLALGSFLLRMWLGHNLTDQKTPTNTDDETFYAQDYPIPQTITHDEIENAVKVGLDNYGLQRVMHTKV